jgi:hypothetical protein
MVGTSPLKDTRSTYLKLDDAWDDQNDGSDAVSKRRCEDRGLLLALTTPYILDKL